jgi:succinyl-CoA synthetase alpha subunit
MSVLIKRHTNVSCQGLTGSQVTSHKQQALAFSTKMATGGTIALEKPHSYTYYV